MLHCLTIQLRLCHNYFRFLKQQLQNFLKPLPLHLDHTVLPWKKIVYQKLCWIVHWLLNLILSFFFIIVVKVFLLRMFPKVSYFLSQAFLVSLTDHHCLWEIQLLRRKHRKMNLNHRELHCQRICLCYHRYTWHLSMQWLLLKKKLNSA